MDVPLLLTYGLLVLAALVLYLPAQSRPIQLTAPELGYLRSGPRGAVLTALVVLRADDLIEVRPRGGVRRTRRARPSGRDRFEGAVYGVLHTPAGLKSLALKPAVRRELATMARRLTGAGMVAGTARVLAGRILLIAAPVAALISVVRGHAGPSGWLTVAVCLATAFAMWRLSPRTIAGHRILRAARRARDRLRAGEDTDRDRTIAEATRDDAKTMSILLAPDIAMGLDINAAAIGLHPLDAFDGGFDADFDGGDFGSADGGGNDYTPA